MTPLTVTNIRPEIGGKATSVTFDAPEAMTWQAGQHLPLRLVIDGTEHRRTYTISNPPGAPLRITVKRVKGGVVSNHIADTVSVGDRIDALPPAGGFKLTPTPQAQRTHFFFGGGSGITPLFAMIHTLLTDEPYSVAHLIYGNRNADEILLKDELEALQAAHPARFTIRHVLSSPSMWSWFSPWRSGRIDSDAISAAFAETPPIAQDVQYWICGPGGMNASIKASLMGLDVPASRIHMESFGGNVEMDTSVPGIAAIARLTLDSTHHDVPIAAGQTVLEAALSAGLTPPHSCQSGVCGSCKARLKNGQVHMRAHMALDDAEVAAGDILTCQSVAASPELSIEFAD